MEVTRESVSGFRMNQRRNEKQGRVCSSLAPFQSVESASLIAVAISDHPTSHLHQGSTVLEEEKVEKKGVEESSMEKGDGLEEASTLVQGALGGLRLKMTKAVEEIIEIIWQFSSVMAGDGRVPFLKITKGWSNGPKNKNAIDEDERNGIWNVWFTPNYQSPLRMKCFIFSYVAPSILV